MNSSPVSIVIPTFNRANYVRKAIDVSLAQTHPVEVIVVDHGSTDDTPQVLADYEGRLAYIRRERDFGPHFCWLEGILHAQHEFVHLQFDDDWIEPGFVSACMETMTDETGFAFCVAGIHNETEDRITEQLFANWMPASGSYTLGELERRITGTMISPGAAVHRREVFIDALYQGRLPLDPTAYHGVGPDCFVSLLSMLRYPRVGYVRERLAVFRAHAGSITMDALSDPVKHVQLAQSYNHVKRFYRELKFLRYLRNPWFKKPLGYLRRMLRIP